MRVKKEEIKSNIEMFVNCIYAEGDRSDWATASEDKWVEAVYREIANWKTVESNGMVSIRQSEENRFDGREELIKRIRPTVKARLKELRAKGLVK